jgi:phospholipid/cholesterol/gamma-HCH transport system substrate-binding protein
MTATRLAAVGAFIIGGLLLFGVGLFMIGDRRMLFGDTVDVHAEFASIAGLENGAIVRVAGMNAGEVEHIHVPPGPSSRFRVRLRVRADFGPLLRTDSVASIQNDGLVGNKFVQIEPGTEMAGAIAPGGTILSREPFDITNLLQKMSDTVDTVSDTITRLRGDIEEALGSVSATARSAQGLVDDVGRDARAIVASTERVASDLEAIVGGVRGGRGVVGKLLTDDALYQSATAIAADAERTVANLRQASDEARAALAGLRGADGADDITQTLQQTLASAREAMTDMAENTEALKRTFFFRGYFNRRGYFDLQDVTVEQYRQGALETSDRRVDRLWIRADLLFQRDGTGEERLSDPGRSRVDSAMSHFVKHAGTGPFVVEGYASGTTAEERFRQSRRRAQLVRDYVLQKYELDPSRVVTMAMGDEADGGPEGNRWNGVALAVFVLRSDRG